MKSVRFVRGRNRGEAHRHRARTVAVAGVLGALAFASAIGTSTAAAASCSGTGCNGKDPYATGCASGAYEVTSAGRYLRNLYGATNGSVIHLFWSPRCQTNWPVVTQPAPCSDVQGTVIFANVENLSTGQWVSYPYRSKTAPTYVWGNMIYSPGPARAFGEIDCNGPYDYSGYSGTA